MNNIINLGKLNISSRVRRECFTPLGKKTAGARIHATIFCPSYDIRVITHPEQKWRNDTSSVLCRKNHSESGRACSSLIRYAMSLRPLSITDIVLSTLTLVQHRHPESDTSGTDIPSRPPANQKEPLMYTSSRF